MYCNIKMKRTITVAAAIVLTTTTNTLSIHAFTSPHSYSSGIQIGSRIDTRSSKIISSTTTTTQLYNRSARRKENKKKKKRRTQPAFIEEEEDSESGANFNEPILLGGGEIGASNEVPAESQIPIAKRASNNKPPQKTKLEQELSGERITEKDGTIGESVVSTASVSDMPTYEGEVQPDVTTVVTDPDTGIARIQQGKYVMDKVTGKAVILSSMGPEYRLAQMFPGVSPEIVDKYRFDWKTITVPEMVQQLKDACTVPLKNSSTGKEWLGIPPHPQISTLCT